MPISFLPNIEIAQLRIISRSQGLPPRNIENTITKPLSSFLKTVNNVKSINSESHEGLSIITLGLRPNINLDIAIIEISEKLDQSMNFLPNDLERPIVIRSSLSDIPVLKISVTPKKSKPVSLVELSDFCEKILKRRIEQQNEVSLADFHGLKRGEIKISPDYNKLRSRNISNEELITSIRQANLSIANISILDGDYQFNVELSNKVNSINEIQNININKEGERYKLKDLVTIQFVREESKSSYLHNNAEGIIINVLKRKNANSVKLKLELEQLILDFRNEYVNLNFDLLDDRTRILDENISNLKMALLYGVLFSGLVLFLFFRDIKLSIIVFLIIPISLVFVLLGYSILGIGLNTISLTGLILGVGLMIDNAIIIIDNIQWEFDNSNNLSEACVKGTQSVVKPLIGSALTTTSVFAPLMLLSDTAGTLFYELSISVILALFLSLAVSYFLLPTALNSIKLRKKKKSGSAKNSFHKTIVQYVLANNFKILLVYLLVVLGGVFVFKKIEKERFPSLTNHALLLKYGWEDDVALVMNVSRVKKYINQIHENIDESSCILGEKQFIKEDSKQLVSGGEIYLIIPLDQNLQEVKNHLKDAFESLYPRASFSLMPHKNTLDYILPVKENQIACYISSNSKEGFLNPQSTELLLRKIRKYQPSYKAVSSKNHFVITIKDHILFQYGLKKNDIINKLKIVFNKNKITSVQRNDRSMDLKLSASDRTDVYSLLNRITVSNSEDQELRLGNFIELETRSQNSVIQRSKYGESIIVEFDTYDRELLNQFKKDVEGIYGMNVNIDGEYFKSKSQLKRLKFIFLIVISLLYMILAAQFESLKIPAIIIAIIPISLIGAVLMLFSLNQSINLVSLVGIIAMSGIVINDAILKIDLILLNRKNNLDVKEAILNASQKRLRPILMTSITTILAFSPIFFTDGLGAELQIPLAISIIGGLVFGTITSIVILPALYYTFVK